LIERVDKCMYFFNVILITFWSTLHMFLHFSTDRSSNTSNMLPCRYLEIFYLNAMNCSTAVCFDDTASSMISSCYLGYFSPCCVLFLRIFLGRISTSTKNGLDMIASKRLFAESLLEQSFPVISIYNERNDSFREISCSKH